MKKQQLVKLASIIGGVAILLFLAYLEVPRMQSNPSDPNLIVSNTKFYVFFIALLVALAGFVLLVQLVNAKNQARLNREHKSEMDKDHELAVSFRNVNKVYKMSKHKADDFYALTDVNFSIHKGEIVGLIGKNGSGKSTSANILVGSTSQTSGSIFIDGNVSVLSVQAGLQNDLTGRENIYMKCYMMGMNKAQIDTIVEDIIDFSEIRKFIDQPVKTYSSGMKARLGFATAIQTDTDILVIDEALSVGDKAFTEKCFDKIEEIVSSGKTIIFVTHSMEQIKKYSKRVIWLHEGKVIGDSRDVEEITNRYNDFFPKVKKAAK